VSPETHQAATLTAFAALASAFGTRLRPGDVVALSGGLGAGKTTFVRSVVSARTGRDEATSPTFTLWHRYEADPPINHLDFYRIDDPAEATELGLEEAFAPTEITLVEWPDKLPWLVPPTAVRVSIEGTGDAPRIVRIERP
jgi:tRNA threonylcarbamoyl adenosine modification protein YjeE